MQLMVCVHISHAQNYTNIRSDQYRSNRIGKYKIYRTKDVKIFALSVSSLYVYPNITVNHSLFFHIR